MFKQFICLAALGLSSPAMSQTIPTDFTTPEGAAFIHQQIKSQILSFSEDGDQDQIYFTAILSWRCGMKELYYGLNDDPTETPFPLEPCYRDLRTPNTMKDAGTSFPISITVPKGSAPKVTLRAVYDDDSSATFEAERAKNLIY